MRDLRSGEIAVLLLALLVAVASLTAVGFLTSRVGPRRRAAGRRGARGRPAARIGRGRLRTRTPTEARQRGLETARILTMPSRGSYGDAVVAGRIALRSARAIRCAAGSGSPTCRSAGAPDLTKCRTRRGVGRFAAARASRRGRRRERCASARSPCASPTCSTTGPTRAGLCGPVGDADDQPRGRSGDRARAAGKPGTVTPRCLPAIRRGSRRFASISRLTSCASSACRPSLT
jgi:hypothetical protein